LYLADVAGWQGAFLEANAVDTSGVERALRGADVPAEPDVLSIQVPGQAHGIWEAIRNYRPRVVVVDYRGVSLDALRALGEAKGYRLVHTELCRVSAFFVRGDLSPEAFPAPADVAVRGA
jgi:hypothetical protein